MLGFQKTVLSIATIFLIFILVLIGYSLSNSSSTTNWPPVVGDCPDYWVDLSGNGEACYNSHNLGTCGLHNKTDETKKTTVDLSKYTDCEKFDWATDCGITWDGITSGILKPCDTTTTEETA